FLLPPRFCAAAYARAARRFEGLLFHLGELLPKRGDVRFVDDLDAGVENAIRRERRLGGFATRRELVHPFGREVAELKWLLDDGHLDNVVRDGVEGAVFFVEHGGEDLALLAERVERGGDGRSVV